MVRTLVKLGLLALVAWGALPSASAYVVVTKLGRRLEAQSEPRYNKGKALIVLPGGMRIIMDEADVDKPATEKANANGELGSVAFRNEDLAKAKGKAVVEGSVTAEAPALDPSPSEPALAPGESIDVGGSDVAVLHRVDVVAPPDAVARREHGVVEVLVSVDLEGWVVGVDVLQSATPALDRAVIEGVRQWRFDRPIIWGLPSEFRLRMTYTFPDPGPPPPEPE